MYLPSSSLSQTLTHASSRVENGNANSAAPGTTSSLASAPKARTNLAAQDEKYKISRGHFRIKFQYLINVFKIAIGLLSNIIDQSRNQDKAKLQYFPRS